MKLSVSYYSADDDRCLTMSPYNPALSAGSSFSSKAHCWLDSRCIMEAFKNANAWSQHTPIAFDSSEYIQVFLYWVFNGGGNIAS